MISATANSKSWKNDMGANIALTGLVIFLTSLSIGLLANSPPKQIGIVRACGLILLLGFFMIPAGIILSIWE